MDYVQTKSIGQPNDIAVGLTVAVKSDEDKNEGFRRSSVSINLGATSRSILHYSASVNNNKELLFSARNERRNRKVFQFYQKSLVQDLSRKTRPRNLKS